MARLYPPVTEEVLSAFCLNYNTDGEKTGASININFNFFVISLQSNTVIFLLDGVYALNLFVAIFYSCFAYAHYIYKLVCYY